MPWTDADVARVAQAQTAEWKRLRDMLRRYDQDAQRDFRQARRLCRSCAYLRTQVVGRAFTKYVCAGCEEERTHPDTATPVLCPACADARGLCVRCGGPREDGPAH